MSDQEYDPACPNDFKLWKDSEINNIPVVLPKNHGNLSKVILILNMTDELDEESEQDVREEASRFGTIVDFVQHHCPESLYKIQFYLKFQTPAAAERALKTFDGRFYNGKKLIATYYSEKEFDKNNLGQFT
jgi:RNA recognition motif-containing protein